MAKLSTTKRGYGAHHQALRERLRPQVEAGVVRCARCGELIPRGALGARPRVGEAGLSRPEPLSVQPLRRRQARRGDHEEQASGRRDSIEQAPLEPGLVGAGSGRRGRRGRRLTASARWLKAPPLCNPLRTKRPHSQVEASAADNDGPSARCVEDVSEGGVLGWEANVASHLRRNDDNPDWTRESRRRQSTRGKLGRNRSKLARLPDERHSRDSPVFGSVREEQLSRPNRLFGSAHPSCERRSALRPEVGGETYEQGRRDKQEDDPVPDADIRSPNRNPPPPFRKRSGFFDAPSDAADQLDETRPTLDFRSLHEVGRLAGVLA
jgi:hypothetical protein